MTRFRTLLMLVGGLFLQAGCVTKLVPPVHVDQPINIYLIDEGRHSSLLVPTDEKNVFREFTYADWNWYVLGNRSLLNSLSTAFLPTQGALGSREWRLPSDATIIGSLIPSDEVHTIAVEREVVQAFRERMEERFASKTETKQRSTLLSMDFVKDDRAYSFASSCNHVMNDWLRELGCEVRGFSLMASFRVEQEQTPGNGEGLVSDRLASHDP